MATVHYPKKKPKRTPSSQVGVMKSKGCTGAKVSDGESCVKGSYEIGESSQKITYERKKRSCCQGDYGKKPPPNAKPRIHFVRGGKSFKEPKAKKTLGYIVREKWDEHTVKSVGAEREEFYERCINEFKEYYEYSDLGDFCVRAYLARNFKSYLNAEKSRLMAVHKGLMECGYTDEELKRQWYNWTPHYYSQRAWNSICEHWLSDGFKKKSKNGKNARKKVEFTPRTGAIPFAQRREEIDAERAAKGMPPITDEEFMTLVYNPEEPVVKDLQEKMKKIRSSEPELDFETTTDKPLSPSTQKDIKRKDVIVAAKARPPKRY